MVIEHAAQLNFLMLTASRARPSGPPFAADSKRVRITICNGSGVEVLREQMVSESTNWIIHADALNYS